ncbi:MAG: 1,6-anhydro-N-acetylmuramyl-L-alanine amidase AmpD [Burkholderiaceae bacterium]
MADFFARNRTRWQRANGSMTESVTALDAPNDWKDGWWRFAEQLESPNVDDRPASVVVDMVVIHHISLPKNLFGTRQAHALFLNRLDPAAHPDFAALADLRVSAHFLIERTGRLTQFVSCERRAWHAGVSEWQGRTRCNDFSIGIELEGSETQGFEDEQYAVLNRLLAALRQRYPIVHHVGHSDIAPGRKVDPGPYFDWRRLWFGPGKLKGS